MKEKNLEVIDIPCEIIDMNHSITEKKINQTRCSILSALHILIKNKFQIHKKYKKTF